jgi:hypothetical protein
MDEARAHILLPPFANGSPATAEEADQVLKLAAAQELIIGYIEAQADEDWDLNTVPFLIKAAIMVQFAEMVRFRGDDPGSIENAPKYDDGQLSPQVTNYLRRWRDPVLR